MPKSKVLIVDDQHLIRFMLEEVLAKSGFKTCSAPNSTEAIDLVKKEQPDIVVLDLNLPDTNGQSLFAELKKFKNDIRAVFISATSDECSIKKVMIDGVLGFFAKPFDILEFAAFLGKKESSRIA